MAETTEWYFDLNKGIAVPASERGPGDRTMGPYPTRGEAENWKATSQSRNDTWDDDDRRWNDGGGGRDGDDRDGG